MDCAICLEDVKLYSCISVLPCGHSYHSMCYSLYNGSVCPLCRSPNMREKFDTIMINSKYLYEWTKDDFNSYISFVNERRDLIEMKRNELKNQIHMKRIEKVRDCIDFFYIKKKNEISYNVIKNISNGVHRFVVLNLKFGDVFRGYPLIFLVAGPKNQEDYFHKNGIKGFLEKLSDDFPLIQFKIKNNKNTMCYELLADF